jgi:zinc protease
VNAYTSFDETVYMLDLPDLKPDTMTLTFGVLRDFADGALLSNEEIDAERGVILAEKASRDSVEYRMMLKQFQTMLPGSLIGERFPIGEEEVIKNAPRERFVDFYRKYYTPERMTFVAVGNIDAAELELTIKETFGTLVNPEKPGTNPDMGKVAMPEGVKAHIFSDRELASTDVSLNLVRPYELKPDTKETRAARFPVEIAHAIMGRRFERITKQENSPVSAGSASKYALFNDLEMGSVSLTAADDRWQEVVPVLEQELRRAKEHGFTEAELSEAKANLLNAYREAVKRKDTRKSDTLATEIARSINEGTVFTTPETDLALAEEILIGIKVEKVHADFVKFWEAPGYHLVLSTKEAPEDAAEALAKLYKKSAETAVEPPASRPLIPFGYTDFGKPGTVTSTVEVEDLCITQIKLANNVRINLKKTDFEKNRIRMMARIGTGQLSQPKDTPLFDKFANAVFDGGGLGKHTNDELSEILLAAIIKALAEWLS